jgi:NifB/MoaA-like Fe-S oxidoreductase
VVPLGVSAHSHEADLRPHTEAEARAVLETVAGWQERFLDALGRRLVFAADEYFVLADRPFPLLGDYEEAGPQQENGIGMAVTFADEVVRAVRGERVAGVGPRSGFFASVDGAPAAGYRAPRSALAGVDARASVDVDAPVGIVTGEYGARVLAPLLPDLRSTAGVPVRLVPVANRFFGGNIAVTGLLTAADVADALAAEPPGHRYLLPDVVLSDDRFLDGGHIGDLPRTVEVVRTDGAALVDALRAAP